MIVRAGVKADIGACLVMAAEFHKIAYGLHGVEFCGDSTRSTFELCIDHGLFCVADDGAGAIGMAAGLKSPLIMNHAVTVGVELCWWVNADYRKTSAGLKLLKKLESMAADSGVDIWTMVLLDTSEPEKIARIYDRMGYVKAEQAYIKVL